LPWVSTIIQFRCNARMGVSFPPRKEKGARPEVHAPFVSLKNRAGR
jgi:hypothetical protein